MRSSRCAMVTQPPPKYSSNGQQLLTHCARGHMHIILNAQRTQAVYNRSRSGVSAPLG